MCYPRVISTCLFVFLYDQVSLGYPRVISTCLFVFLYDQVSLGFPRVISMCHFVFHMIRYLFAILV